MRAVSRLAHVLLICTGSSLALSCSGGEQSGKAATADTARQNPPVEEMVHDSMRAATSDSGEAGSPGAADGANDVMAGMDHGAMAGMGQSGSTPSESATGHAGHLAAPGRNTAARGDTRPAPADHAGMSGMDHSAMGTGRRRAQPQSTTPAGSAGMIGMDHTGADAPPRGGAARMSGMEHGAVPPVPVGSDSDLRTTTQLHALVRILLRDPQVRAALQQDTALARRWSNEAVRRRLTGPGQ